MWSRIPPIGPTAYARIALAALVILVLIVFSGAAVRLTGSGLGCPTWPECNGRLIQTELSSHGWIEYGNRLVTGLVSVLAILAALGAFLRRPFRRDLAILGLLLPGGVIVQIALGGLSVLAGLAPGWVMAHFATSMLILAAAVALAWRARYEPGLAPSNPERTVLAVRALLPVAAWVLFLGTVTTASGPHPGATDDDTVVTRLHFHGGDTLEWMYHWHGRFSTAFGVLAVAVWLYAWRTKASIGVRRALTVLCLLLAAQGVVGLVQYANALPATLVWVHVVLATCNWLAVLWAVAAVGRLRPAASDGGVGPVDRQPEAQSRDLPPVVLT